MGKNHTIRRRFIIVRSPEPNKLYMNIVNSQRVRKGSALICSLNPVKPFRNLHVLFSSFLSFLFAVQYLCCICSNCVLVAILVISNFGFRAVLIASFPGHCLSFSFYHYK